MNQEHKKNSKRILVVDDDHAIRFFLEEALKDLEYDVAKAEDGTQALKMAQTDNFDLIISDLKMPEMDGLELLLAIKEEKPDIGFIFMSAYGTVDDAVKAMQNGAFDFVTKPFSIAEIEARLNKYFEVVEIKSEVKILRKKVSRDTRFSKIIGASPAMQDVFSLVDIVADSDASVFITGESGTGKEMVARAIHENSNRAPRPFLQINCAAIPDNLIESTLYGYEKGAFTGAQKTTNGLFQEAHTGTLLLDEITELPLAMQAKLLRALQEKQVNRVGSFKQESVDIRIVATSNQKIQQMVKDGKFREDLYFRLNVFPIELPPLRQRREDIPALLNHFLSNFAIKYSHEVKQLSDAAMDAVINHNWQGNVRELQNITERAVLFSKSEAILQPRHFFLESEKSITHSGNVFNGNSTMEDIEREVIFATLKRTNNNRTRAAKILDVSVRTLRNKLNLYANKGVLPEEFMIEGHEYK